MSPGFTAETSAPTPCGTCGAERAVSLAALRADHMGNARWEAGWRAIMSRFERWAGIWFLGADFLFSGLSAIGLPISLAEGPTSEPPGDVVGSFGLQNIRETSSSSTGSGAWREVGRDISSPSANQRVMTRSETHRRRASRRAVGARLVEPLCHALDLILVSLLKRLQKIRWITALVRLQVHLASKTQKGP